MANDDVLTITDPIVLELTDWIGSTAPLTRLIVEVEGAVDGALELGPGDVRAGVNAPGGCATR